MALSEPLAQAIAEEERILAEVTESLRAQLQKTAQDFRDEAVRARALTSRIVAATRDEDKQMLASDEAVSHGLTSLKKQGTQDLTKLLDNPYFGRVVVEEELPNGKLTTIDFKIGTVSNSDCRIVDWRKSPRAKLFYEYKEGDEYCEEIQGQDRVGRMLVRNKLRIENGKLVGISCSAGDASLRNGEWHETSFRSAGEGGRSYNRLPDVFSLISPEQFRAITEDAQSAALIQGVAGSGKSTVALYRLSWLLHHEGATLKPSSVLILVRSGVLKQYLSASLPTLDCEGVSVLTVGEWVNRLSVPGVDPRNELPAVETAEAAMGSGRVKRTFAVLKSIEDYVERQVERFEAFLHQEGPSAGLLPDKAEELRALARKGRNGYLFPWLTLCKEFVSSLPPQNGAVQFLEKLSVVEKRLQLFFEDLIRIFSQPASVLRFDDTRLLDHGDISGAKESLERAKATGSYAMIDRLLLICLMQQKGFPLQDRTGRDVRYEHVIVDEVQDFSATELAVVLDTCDDKKNLTLVGDTSQEILATGTFPGWEKLRRFWEFSEGTANYVSLQVSHRSTLPIMKLAAAITGTTITDGRPGKAPLWFRCKREEHGVTEAIGWLERVTERMPSALTVVLCRSDADARYVESLLEPRFGALCRLGTESDFSFEEGIVVSSVASVKGLEFPNVLLWNPSSRDYPDTPLHRNLLYIAMTRAEEHLALLTWGAPSPCLPSPGSRLYRVVDCEEEVADPDEDAQPIFASRWDEPTEREDS